MQATTKDYKIKDNQTGKVHTLRGPVDATEDELASELERLLTVADQAEKFPTEAERKADVMSGKRPLPENPPVPTGSFMPEFLSRMKGAIEAPFLHPVDTAKGLAGQAKEALSAYSPGLSNPPSRTPSIITAIGEQAEKEGPAAATGGALGDLAGAAVVGRAIPPAIKGVKSVVNKVADRVSYFQDRPVIFTQPEGHLQQALKPDLDPAGLKLAGDLLKHGEEMIKKPVKDIDSLRLAEKAIFDNDLMPRRRAIIDPQAEVMVPGSGRAMRKAAVAAIPDDILPGTPEYQRLWTQIRESIPGDMTLGQLEKMTSSLNQQNSTFHSAKLGQALTKMETAQKAIDIGKEASGRQIMLDGMEKMGLGGVEALREVNKRIGVLIKIRDAVDSAEKAARTEATVPTLRRGVQLAKATVGTVKGPVFTVNENIASAMRKWRTETGLDIMANTRLPLPTSRQLPANASASRQMGEGWAGGTGGVTTPVVAEGTRAGRTGRLLTEGARQMPGEVEKTFNVTTGPELTGRMIPEKAGGPHVQGEGWKGGTGVGDDVTNPALAKGPFTGKPLIGKQLPLQPTVIAPANVRRGPATPIFGVGQSVGKVVPPGSKLVFKTKMLDGSERFHYETPDGQMIETDIEVNPWALPDPYALPQPPRRTQ